MDMYDRLLHRMIDLMNNQFIEVYNKFAIQCQNKKNAIKEYETLMLLLASYIYFKDDSSRFDVFIYKCAFNLRYPDYYRKVKSKIIQNIVEAGKISEQAGPYYDIVTRKFILDYSFYLQSLLDQLNK